MYDLETLVTDLLKANGLNPAPGAETAQEMLNEELYEHWNSIVSGTGDLGKWEVVPSTMEDYYEGGVSYTTRAKLTLHDGTVLAIHWSSVENSWSEYESVESVNGPFYVGPSGRLQDSPVTLRDYREYRNELEKKRADITLKMDMLSDIISRLEDEEA